jgi:NTP pyrophosphatase (non-canonical NTP hydrolase)
MSLSYLRYKLFPSKEEKLFTEWYLGLKRGSVQWNTERLPDNTLSMQLRKIVEEVTEVLDATTRQQQIKEKADVLIAIFGLARFSKVTSLILEETFLKLNGGEIKDILLAAGEKMNLLWDRTYVKKGNVYHHIIQ